MLEREIAHLTGNPGVMRDVKAAFERLGFARLARETKEHYAYFSSFEESFERGAGAARAYGPGSRGVGRVGGVGVGGPASLDGGGGAGRAALLPPY